VVGECVVRDMAQFEVLSPYLPTPRVSKTRPTALFYAAHGHICELNIRYKIRQQERTIAVMTVCKKRLDIPCANKLSATKTVDVLTKI